MGSTESGPAYDHEYTGQEPSSRDDHRNPIYEPKGLDHVSEIPTDQAYGNPIMMMNKLNLILIFRFRSLEIDIHQIQLIENSLIASRMQITAAVGSQIFLNNSRRMARNDPNKYFRLQNRRSVQMNRMREKRPGRETETKA
jgi:hypothetical protein